MSTQKEPITLKPQQTCPKETTPTTFFTSRPVGGQSSSTDSEESLESQVEKHSSMITPSEISLNTAAYPEGGLEAWLVVFGAFMGTLACFGLLNSMGVFQAYVSTHQLQKHKAAEIGWVFSIYSFLSFFCGVQIGPIFDAKGPRWLIFAGSILLVSSMLLTGICKELYQFVICFGILGGVGTSLIFTAAFAAIGHFFFLKRGTATGIAIAGGSVGAIIFPLMLQHLLPRVGFAWSTRVLAFIFLLACIPANLFVRSRLPPKPGSTVMPDIGIFTNYAFSLACASFFFLQMAIFTPVTYLPIFVQQSGTMSNAFSYQIVAIYSAGSCVGRWVSGWVADRIGRFNAMLLTLIICGCSTFIFWLPSAVIAVSTSESRAIRPLAIFFAIIFGFSSGSGISLEPVVVGQLCITEEYGRFFATANMVFSFSALVGIPMGGAVINACGDKYWGLAVFTGICSTVSFVCLLWARALKVGWEPGKRY